LFYDIIHSMKTMLLYGQGVYKYVDGGLYDGHWKNGLRHGNGTYKWASGSIYHGDWKGGKQHGKGTYKWACGDVYEGDWKNGKRNGKGTFKTASGEVYEGRWKDSKKHGTGIYKYAETMDLATREKNMQELSRKVLKKTMDVKQYIRETIPEGTQTKYYNPRLLIVTLTKWQKYIHDIVLNDAISYYKKVPNKMPTEVKSRIVSYLITPHILSHL
jgi:hypothetical protein